MPTRSSIIICCPGQGEQYLPGAIRDVENYIHYRCSPKGGQWYRNEITVLENPGYEQTMWYIANSPADYQDIYFTGHGGTQGNNRLLAFKDVLIPDTWLLNNTPRQLIIVDACRNYLRAINGIPEAEDVYSSFDGSSKARAVFDLHIENSPYGKMIVHATHDGSVANDISNLGGAFSYTLLQTAMNFVTGSEYSPRLIEQLLPYVDQQLNASGYRQRPGIVHREGNLLVPFMIDAPQIIKERVYVEAAPVEPPALNLWPLLGIGLAIYGFSTLFKEQ